MRALAGLFALLLFGCCCMSHPRAEASPSTLDKQQFEALVEAVSRSVVRKLEDDGAVRISATPASRPSLDGPDHAGPRREGLDREAGIFVQRAAGIVSAYPLLWSTLGRIPAVLDQGERVGRSLPVYALMLVAAVATAWGTEAAVRIASTPARRWLDAGSDGPAALWSVVLLAAFDGFALLALCLVGYGALGVRFGGSEPQSRLAGLVLAGFVAWRFYLFGLRVVFRPDMPRYRLADIPDADARAIGGRLAVIVALVLAARTLVRFLEGLDVPRDALGAAILFNVVLGLALFVWAAWSARRAVACWLGRLATLRDGRSVRAVVAHRWLVLAIPFFVVLAAADVYGAVLARPTVPSALMLTLNLAIGLLLFEVVLDYIRRTLVARADRGSGQGRPEVFDLVARCLRMGVQVAVAVVIAQTWIVDVLGLVAPDQWRSLARSSLRAGITVFASYVAWQVIDFFAARCGPGAVAGTLESADSGGAAAADATATRFVTLVPLLKVFLGGTIGTVSLLVVLSEVGVNITPLLAGASVFGLAISFGSQTLVRDIVSGVFYLADDAFRVGEYIDCGKAKGTVEGFTMRSLRLRHQNGPVHTIPFGQLGQITNFSRGWSVVKFNLRFARDTDIDKLRKLVKQIGLEMMDDPELKAELMQPLKMMGVDEIADNALVVRFKFTVRPSNPGMVQREAVARMFRAFPEAGVQFSNGTAPVLPIAGPVEPVAAEAPGGSAPAKVHVLVPGA